MSINIIKCTSTANTTSCNRIPEYIVLHYTAGVNSKAGTAKGVANYFSKSTTKASADFIVDQETIVQYNPDPTKRYCWAVGGSKYSRPSTTEGGKYYGIAKNSNSVSIEMCSNKKSTKTLNATDTDWYLDDKVVNNALILTKYLMDLYHIPAEKVIMHHSVTGKICPNPWCVNEKSLAGWKEFKSRLTNNTIPTKDNKDQSENKSQTTKSYWRVFAGTYSSETNCLSRVKFLKAKGYNAIIKKIDGYFKIQVAAYESVNSAEKMKIELSKIGVAAYVVFM